MSLKELSLEELSKYSKVSIIYSLDPEALVATALLINFLSVKEIDFEFAPFYAAPKPVDSSALTLLVGVRQSKAVSGTRIRLLQDLLGSRRFVALKILGKLKDLWVVPPNSVAMALAASIASFKGSSYDVRILEPVRNEVVDFESSGVVALVDESLRLFRYPNARLSECVFRTLEPFIPGASLSATGCKRLVEELGISDRAGVLSDEEKERLVKHVAKLWESKSVRAPSLAGPRFVYRRGEGFDVYEVAYSMLAAIDRGVHELTIASTLNPRYLPALIATLELVYDDIAKVVDAVISGELKPSRSYIRGLKLEILDLEAPMNTCSKLLRAHGLASSTVVYRAHDAYCVPLTDVEPSWPWEEEAQIYGGALCVSSLDRVARLLI